MISEKLKAVLGSHGWHEDYSVNEELIVNTYSRYGFPLFDNVLSLLKSVGLLKIEFVNPKTQKTDNFDFDFDKSCRMEVPERLKEEYNPRTKSELTVIGTAYRDYYILMVDKTGCPYLAYDSLLFRCGETLEEGLQNIINGNDFVEIPYLEESV